MKKSKNIFNNSIGCGLPGRMMRLMATRLSASVAMMVCTAFFAAYAAEPARYPVKPIRLVVPQQAGSSNDTLSRVMAIFLGESLGQQVVVDNRPGAGGVIGMEIAAAALPDGYTLLSMATAQVISPHLQKNLAYDTFKDFAPISQFGITYNVLITHPSVNAAGAKDFVALAKSRPGQINMASAGPGSQSHLAGVMFSLISGINVLHVPYKGAGASISAVLGNESQFSVTPLPATVGHIKSGRLKALALSSKKRSQNLPEIPTFSEQGINFESSGWNGLIAQHATPKPVLDRLYVALGKVVTAPAFREQMARQGAEVIASNPQEFAQFIRKEFDLYGPVVKAANLKAD
jgi:tripartite-type tricarboxylate transporter receptor subunit TctC